MRTKALVLICIAVFVLGGCGKTAGPVAGSTATVALKDGSSFTGTVTKSGSSDITLQGVSGEIRTYPMAAVNSVQYSPAPDSSTVQAQSVPQPATTSSYASAPAYPPAFQPPPVEEARTIPPGSTLRIRNNETINSDNAAAGQTYSAVVAEAVLDTHGRVAIPRGSSATLVVREAEDQGRMQGRSELVLDVSSVEVGGHHYRLETSDVVAKGREGVGANRRTAEFAGGGAALGGIIGAIAGGGKGAAIGALAGGGAGTATQAMTRGDAVRVSAETMLIFKLEAPVRIHEMQ